MLYIGVSAKDPSKQGSPLHNDPFLSRVPHLSLILRVLGHSLKSKAGSMCDLGFLLEPGSNYVWNTTPLSLHTGN